VLDSLQIYLVETMDEVLKTALAGPLPSAPPPETGTATGIGEDASGTRH
jgi:hypothetical protein